MTGLACRVVATLVIACISFAATAQVIPPSAQPRRERERFTQPQAPQAQPGGPAVSLPSTVPPPGADKVKLVIRGVRIVASTIYHSDELRSRWPVVAPLPLPKDNCDACGGGTEARWHLRVG